MVYANVKDVGTTFIKQDVALPHTGNVFSFLHDVFFCSHLLYTQSPSVLCLP
jgi:hypothetical protein